MYCYFDQNNIHTITGFPVAFCVMLTAPDTGYDYCVWKALIYYIYVVCEIFIVPFHLCLTVDQYVSHI